MGFCNSLFTSQYLEGSSPQTEFRLILSQIVIQPFVNCIFRIDIEKYLFMRRPMHKSHNTLQHYSHENRHVTRRHRLTICVPIIASVTQIICISGHVITNPNPTVMVNRIISVHCNKLFGFIYTRIPQNIIHSSNRPYNKISPQG